MNMKNYILLSLTIVVLLFTNCVSDEFTLERSVFIEDIKNPNLPVYSEWGYNTFGVYIDRKPFVSNNIDFPAKIIVNVDTLNLILRGDYVSSTNNYYYSNQGATLKFIIKGYPLEVFDELITLNNRTIDLKSDSVKLILTIGKDTSILDIMEGKLEFKRVQNLYIDNEFTKVIMSGYFNFKTFMNNEPVAVSNGRFDLGIGDEDFF